MRPRSRRTAGRRAALAFAALAFAAPPAAAAPYTVTDLGTLGGDRSEATGLNERGEVVGDSAAADTGVYGFTWDAEAGMRSLGKMSPETYSGPSINEAGQVALSGPHPQFDGFEWHAYRWAAGGSADLGAVGTPDCGEGGGCDEGPLDWSFGNGIDDAGTVVGTSTVETPPGEPGDLYPAVWSGAGSAARLPGTQRGTARAIAPGGRIAGSHGLHAATWENAGAPPVDLGLLPGDGTRSDAYDVNATGRVVGASETAPGARTRAFEWTEAGGMRPIADPNTLGSYSAAAAVNGAGVIVGTSAIDAAGEQRRAFIRRPGGPIVDLNTLIDAGSGWVLTGARDIADNGRIAGVGLHDGRVRAFLLSPTLTVDALGDAPDADPADSVCATVQAACTLRAAIQEANARPGHDDIAFALPSPRRISPAEPLPALTEPARILGSTQPSGRVVLSGGSAGDGAAGLHITGGGSVVEGLVIGDFDGYGILVEGGGGSVLRGNRIGTTPAGGARAPNGTGVRIDGSTGNLVGGDGADGNLISGNEQYGVDVNGVENAGANRVAGNLIGTTAAGDAPLPNTTGVRVNVAPGTIIGPGNRISGNGLSGVEVHFATGAVVEGNVIGTDAEARSLILGNGEDGVWVHQNSEGARVEGNLVASNGRHGIFIQKERSDDGGHHLVAGNLVAVDRTGATSAVLGNDAHGILVDDGLGTRIERNQIGQNALDGIVVDGRSEDVVVSANEIRGPNGNGIVVDAAVRTMVGGREPGQGNVIERAALRGVFVTHLAQGASILGNSITGSGDLYDHGELLGIDLVEGDDRGPTPNDPGDADTGGNGLVNAPVITSFHREDRAGSATVEGRVEGRPGETFRLELFGDDACDRSGYGEGRRLLRAVDIAQPGPAATFSFVVPVDAVVAATVTDSAGNTSEFSACVPIGSAAQPPAPDPPGPPGAPTSPFTAPPPAILPLTPVALRTVARRQTVRAVARTGAIRASCSLDTAGACTVVATIAARDARRLGLRARRGARVRIGRGNARLPAAGSAQVKVRLTAKARRALRRARRPLRVALVFTATAPGRAPARAGRRLTLAKR